MNSTSPWLVLATNIDPRPGPVLEIVAEREGF